MPSAAKPPAMETALSSLDSGVPIRQIITTVEHKIRNLEKRKSKLQTYQDLQKSGKDLTNDQEQAVSKYDEVVQCLLFARELFKQILSISTMWEKEQKKLFRRETASRIQNEVTKVKDALVIQEILRQMQQPDTRSDFLNGTNEAAQLAESDVELLDKLAADSAISITTAMNLETLALTAQKAADHLVSTIDGKPKTFHDTNYDKVRSVIRAVQDCGYFDKKFGGAAEATEEGVIVGDGQAATDLNNGGRVVEEGLMVEEREEDNEENVRVLRGEEPGENGGICVEEREEETEEEVIHHHQVVVEAVIPPVIDPRPPLPAGHELMQQQAPPPPQMQISPKMHVLPIIPGMPAIIAPTVNDVEESYFKQHQNFVAPNQPQVPPPQQQHPPSLPEVLESGTFFFLQESEIDQPDPILVNPTPPIVHANPSPVPPPSVLIMPVQPIPLTSNPAALLNGNHQEVVENGEAPPQIRPGVFPFFKANQNLPSPPQTGTTTPLNPVQQLVEVMSRDKMVQQHQFGNNFGNMMNVPSSVVHQQVVQQNGVSNQMEEQQQHQQQSISNSPDHNLQKQSPQIPSPPQQQQQQQPPVEDQMKNISEWKDVDKAETKSYNANDHQENRWMEKRERNYNNENGNNNNSWNNNDNNYNRRRYDRGAYNNGGAPRGSNGENGISSGGGYRGNKNSSYMGHKTYSNNRNSVGGGNSNNGGGGGGGGNVFYRNNDPNYYQNGAGNNGGYKSRAQNMNMGANGGGGRPSGDGHRRNNSHHREKNNGQSMGIYNSARN